MGMTIDGKSGFRSVVPVVAASSAYSSGQIVGGLLTIKEAFQWRQSGVLESLCLADAANNKGAMDIFFFKGKPAGTYADGAAFAPSAADLNLISGFVSILTTSWSGGSGNAVADLSAIAKVVINNSVGSNNAEPENTNANYFLYAVIVARSTPTYNTAADLQLSVGILQD